MSTEIEKEKRNSAKRQRRRLNPEKYRAKDNAEARAAASYLEAS